MNPRLKVNKRKNTVCLVISAVGHKVVKLNKLYNLMMKVKKGPRIRLLKSGKIRQDNERLTECI